MHFIRLVTIALSLTAATGCWAGERSATDERPQYRDVPSGTLLMPGEREATGHQTQSESSRKCMKVCKQWGEDCIIDPKLGTRKCRRSCEQFGVECF